jgi:cyclase
MPNLGTSIDRAHTGRMSSRPADITTPGRPYVQEVSPGIYAYVQPDGTWWINNTGFLAGPQGVISCLA